MILAHQWELCKATSCRKHAMHQASEHGYSSTSDSSTSGTHETTTAQTASKCKSRKVIIALLMPGVIDPHPAQPRTLVVCQARSSCPPSARSLTESSCGNMNPYRRRQSSTYLWWLDCAAASQMRKVFREQQQHTWRRRVSRSHRKARSSLKC